MNESIYSAIEQVTIGPLAQQILYFFGGLAGATIIFFITSLYISYNNQKILKKLMANNEALMKEIIRLRKENNALLRKR